MAFSRNVPENAIWIPISFEVYSFIRAYWALWKHRLPGQGDFPRLHSGESEATRCNLRGAHGHRAYLEALGPRTWLRGFKSALWAQKR